MTASSKTRGVLFLVVGASGAGKDSVLDGARRAFAEDARISFPRRIVTRPANAGGEDHIPMSEAAFHEAAEDGSFLLFWRANGLGYGIPGVVRQELDKGVSAVLNVSRSVIDEARVRFPPVTVFNIVARPDVLRDRLLARGRENEQEIEARLERAGAFRPAGRDVVTIDNSGLLDDAVQAFCRNVRVVLDAAPVAG